MCLVLILSGILVSVLYLLYRFVTKNNNYWKNRNVPFIEPSFFYGSLKDQIFNKKSWISFPTDCYNMFKKNGIGGVFILTTPVLYVCDLALIEKILIEDFRFFQDRWLPDERVSNSLTFGRGVEWRNLRLKLAPTFASGKIRAMFQQIFTATNRTLRNIERNRIVEMETLATDFSIEVIASCMFGVDMSDSYECTQLKKAMDQIYINCKNQSVCMLLYLVKPKLYNLFKHFKKTEDIFSDLIKSIITFRMKNKSSRRDDILQMMLELQEKGEKTDRKMSTKDTNQENKNAPNPEGCTFTSSNIGCLMYNFLFSGIKPTAVTIKFALFEIARHSHIQKSIQEEVDSSVIKFNTWNSEALDNMTYLDQVIQETLRLYSFTTTLMRTLTERYTLPGTDVTLEKDMHVFVPIDAIHKDPDFYPDPHEFKPERFEGHNYKPTSTFLPFGQGPRICVSIRLAVTMVKLCLARILSQYEVKISSKMQLPLELSGSAFYPQAKGGMWLQFEKRQNV